MKRKITLIFVAIFFLSLFDSCKYEDGPFISFYTKKSRIEGYWEFHKVTVNGEDISEEYKTQVIQFMKSEKCIWFLDIETSSIYDMDPEYTDVGYWDLQNDKEELFIDIVTVGRDPFSLTWEILQLKFHEMKLERYENENRIVWELKKII